MPLYAVASWHGLHAKGGTGEYVLPVALVGWIWAVINVCRTKRLDLGVVTFFLVLIAAVAERWCGLTNKVKLALTAASLLVAANYSLVVLFWGEIKKDLAKAKSSLWMNVFWGYCACMTAFWLCAAAKTHARGESG
ncbi:hypothetical protein ACHAWF_000130 [Thalassiosira exigua]